MRKIFDNRQLAHVWAAQSQETGKNPTNTMYFQGDTIYSYGRHYPMARIYNNGAFALVNSYGYSNSTMKQRGMVASALRGRMAALWVPRPDDAKHPDNESYLLDVIAERVTDLINPRKHWYAWTHTGPIIELNKYYELIGSAKRFTLCDDLETLIRDAYKIKIDRQLDKDKMREIREAAKARASAELYSNLIKLWVKRQTIEKIPANAFPYDYVRYSIDESEVETSRGARVPTSEVKRALAYLSQDIKISGYRVGHFTIDSEPDAQGFFKVGCHRLNINQIREAIR